MGEPIKKLAIVGASVRAAAFSALRAGFEVVAADLFADADLRRVCSATRVTGYPDALADWLARTECDAWLYTGALENYPELVDRMAAMRPLLGNSGDSLRAVRSPQRLAAALQAAGLKFPEMRTAADGLPMDGRWLVKSYRSSSGSGVRPLIEQASESQRAHSYFQRRIAGESASALYVGNRRGAALLGVTRQLVGEPWVHARPFHYCGTVAPLEVGHVLAGRIARIGQTIAQSFELVGLFGVDLVIADGEPWVIEVNPRYTAAVEAVELACGVHSMAAHVDACTNAALPEGISPGDQHCSVGKAILFARQDVRITAGFFCWAIEQAMCEPRMPPLADVPVGGQTISAGDPVLTILVAAPPENCLAMLRQRVAEVELRLYDE